MESAFTNEIIALFQCTRQRMAVAVNAVLTLLYWHIGQRINQYILHGERLNRGKKSSALYPRN